MYITLYSSYISENRKSYHHTDLSCPFLREYLFIITRHAVRPRISLSAFYGFSQKLIFPLVLKILMSVKYECNGICVENS